MPRAGPNKQMSRSSQKNRARSLSLSLSLFFFFFPVSVMFSLHQNPLAIVQQQATSLHMFGYCSITLLLPPAHSFNRPACYIKMISTVIPINPPQQCKIFNCCKAGPTAGYILVAKISIKMIRVIQKDNGPLPVNFRIPQTI